MKKSFGDALKERMDRDGTRIAELAHATGVSEDIIKKLRSRPGSGTNPEDAVRLAAYFGATIMELIEGSDPVNRLASRLELLSEDEKRLLLAQIDGILQNRPQR